MKTKQFTITYYYYIAQKYYLNLKKGKYEAFT